MPSWHRTNSTSFHPRRLLVSHTRGAVPPASLSVSLEPMEALRADSLYAAECHIVSPMSIDFHHFGDMNTDMQTAKPARSGKFRRFSWKRLLGKELEPEALEAHETARCIRYAGLAGFCIRYAKRGEPMPPSSTKRASPDGTETLAGSRLAGSAL